jgi:hypothetical protein
VMHFQEISCPFLLACSLGHLTSPVFSQKPWNAPSDRQSGIKNRSTSRELTSNVIHSPIWSI